MGYSASLKDGSEPKINFIENPLPLPKKSVIKALDYDYEFKEGDLKFDYEVSTNAEFDI